MANCTVCGITITRKIDGGHRVDRKGNVKRWCTNCTPGNTSGKNQFKKANSVKTKNAVPQQQFQHQTFSQKFFVDDDLAFQQVLDTFIKSLSKFTRQNYASLVATILNSHSGFLDLEEEKQEDLLHQFETYFLKAIILQTGSSIKIDRAIFNQVINDKQVVMIDTEHDSNVIEISLKGDSK